MNCEICGLEFCARRAAWPDGSKCREYVALRRSPPGPSTIPVGPPPKPLRPLEESLRLRELVRACPHLIPKQAGDGCSCYGGCSAGKGDLHGGKTSYRNCEVCREKLQLHRATGTE